MRRFTFKNKSKVDININDIKWICGNNYELKDMIWRTVQNYIAKMSDSEYALDKEYKSYILFDDKNISLNDFSFFFVYPYFDISSDSKLGAKSLSLAYVNSLTDTLEYTDTYQTASLLIEELSGEISECASNDLFGKNISIDFTKKSLIKLMSFNALMDDLMINNYDFTLEQKILLQLDMISVIARTTKKNMVIFCDIPIVTKEIYKLLSRIKGYKFLFFERTEVKPDSNDFLFLKGDAIDMADEDLLYELLQNENCVTLEELKEKMVKEEFDWRFHSR